MDPVLEKVKDEYGRDTWLLSYDGSIEDGIITIRPWGHGVGIEVNGKYLCAIDLWHMSDESNEEDNAHGCAQVVIDPEDGGDSLAFVRRFPDGRTEMFFDDGVEEVRVEHGRVIWGYAAPLPEVE